MATIQLPLPPELTVNTTQAANQAFSTNYQIPFNNVVNSIGSGLSLSTPVINIAAAGLYRVSVQFLITDNADWAKFGLRLNGTTLLATLVPGGPFSKASYSGVLSLSASSTLDVYCIQGTGSIACFAADTSLTINIVKFT